MPEKRPNNNRRRTLIRVLSVVFILSLFASYGWWFKHGRHYQNIKKESVIKTDFIYGGGEGGGESVYGVSPNKRWVVYCRSASKNDPYNIVMVVRDLIQGSSKIASLGNKRDLLLIRRALFRGCWNEDHLFLGNAGRGKAQILDLPIATTRIITRNKTQGNCTNANENRYNNPYTFRDFGDKPFTGGAEIISEETSEVLVTFPARLGLWTVRPKWPSPDNRFIIILASRRNFFECLLLLTPIGAMGGFERTFLYLFDTQKDKLYKLDKVSSYEEPLWQPDSRAFHYVRSSRNRKGSEIILVKIGD